MAETVAPITLKCKVCGGDIVNDYLSGECVCAHCGNRWPMDEMLPEYKEYAGVIEKIKKAKGMLDGKPDVTSASQAKLLYLSANTECLSHTSAISGELSKICKEGADQADKVKTYARGLGHFDRKSYAKALSEFSKIPGFRDTEELIEKCKELAIAERKKRIPLAIVIGMVLPAILCIFLKEKVGLPIWADIPIFLLCSAGLAYAVYLEGKIAVVVEVLSFICAVPLIIFMILAYGFHMDVRTAAIIAVGAPVAVIVALGILFGREKMDGNN